MTQCGLLTGSNKPVPLRSGSVMVLIRGFVADVGCELPYRNEEPGPVEAVFVFPVDTEAAVYAFQARLAEACIRGKKTGSLMGDPAVMVTLLPSLPEAVPGQSPAREFIFLLDRSGSMECPRDGRDHSPQRIDSAKEKPGVLSPGPPCSSH
ncbi:uncharacterized protein LOC125622637 isoform X2 [Caretta caretta]|uniref:uncharacterized protein LOC125622637 isoform X2 n=1 Tax=Caretta caretta TaxID=8467 RepID=UPI002094D8F3|nr:von Willebrand factor A domain-containing protein 5A-like isoform X2 [Caretta caretta]